jgi:hypothetical protein
VYVAAHNAVSINFQTFILSAIFEVTDKLFAIIISGKYINPANNRQRYKKWPVGIGFSEF